jgi:hypothetical protein
MMKVYSARLSLKGTSTIYMGSIPIHNTKTNLGQVNLIPYITH